MKCILTKMFYALLVALNLFGFNIIIKYDSDEMFVDDNMCHVYSPTIYISIFTFIHITVI